MIVQITVKNRSLFEFIFLLALVSVCAFFLGCSDRSDARDNLAVGTVTIGSNSININTATAEELTDIPFVGPGIAAKIIEFRTTYGPFRRAEHLMLVPGIGEKRFRQIREFIRVE